MSCSPQRFLANNRNVLRTAILTPSSVLGVENKVIPLSNPRFGVPARQGNASVTLTGTYTGFEPADYDIQILSTDVDIERVSAPTSYGAGSGTVTDITAAGSPQTIIAECQSAGIEAAAASATIEGATVKAALEGTDGNAIRIDVDRSALVFADTNFSLVADLEPGQGALASPLIGQAYDWATVALTNGLIPETAQRIAFADDPSTVYRNYKDYIDGAWQYYLIPSLTRSVPKGTRIQTVTGGRTVIVSKGATVETTTSALPGGVVTAYDFLNWVRTESQLLVVTTPVPNDRSPTGLASREFSLRTDAYAEVSSGTGSSYATGFTGVTVAAGAGTQLVTAECIGATSADHPNARLGHTLWTLKSSLLGDLGIIAEGVPFSGTQFGLTIPVELGPAYDVSKGSIGATVNYATRTEAESEPPICVAGLALGSDAVDKTVTFRYTTRPTGDDCDCTGMTIPPINERCLGVPGEGGSSVSYQDDTNTRLTAFRSWAKELIRDASLFPTSAIISAAEARFVENPLDGSIAETAHFANPTLSLEELVDEYEATIAAIDPLPPASPGSYREAGMTAWDAAVAELQADIADYVGLQSPQAPFYLRNIPSNRYTASLKWALASAGIANVGGADASTVSGDGCWRDLGHAAWWVDVDGVYMPLFTNARWYFSRKTANGVISTHEATGIINVDCEDDLKDGDTVTITILNASRGSTYQTGDVHELPIVAASPLSFTGGVTGEPVQTWTVHGSATGPFPPYLFNPESPVAYAQTVGSDSVGFLLVEGGIPPAKGDRFQWAVEGGRYQWRKDGGAWDGNSPPLSIPVGSVALDAGLSVTFIAGASASFVADDIFKFRATQPWAVSNLQRPTPAVWKWADESPSNATLESGDLGAVEQIDFFAMVHTLPAGAGAVLWGGADSDADDWSEPLTWRADVIKKAIDRTARYLRLELTNAEGGSIQWAWAGVPVSTRLSADVQLTHSYQVNRVNAALGGRYVGRGLSAAVSWTEATLPEDEAAALIAMLNHVKENDDEPLLFVPNVERDEVVFGRVNIDDVTFVDPFTYNQKAQFERKVSVSLPIESALL